MVPTVILVEPHIRPSVVTVLLVEEINETFEGLQLK